LADEDASNVREVRIDHIRPNPYQPRREFDPQKLAELVQSIREHGVLQPVLLRRVAVDSYELIVGERRLRAAHEAGLRTVPALVKECTDAQMLEVALIENVQREDINPVEAASAYQRLITEFGLTQEEIAARVGKARSTIANTLRLLSLPPEILESVRTGEISEAHARALLQAPPDARLKAWEAVKTGRMTSHEAEKFTRSLREGRPAKAVARIHSRIPIRKDPDHAAIEDSLQQALGTKVTLKESGGIGKIEIEFYSPEELEGIVERILGRKGNSDA
ncbi:MAG TPA: ParB/RepB/Spo0J family partition protein, partial [Chthonomonadales bacterium]|nr:ParB/RepB/Spo0J family partition protein [Chthonomonadales bacterium]